MVLVDLHNENIHELSLLQIFVLSDMYTGQTTMVVIENIIGNVNLQIEVIQRFVDHIEK